VFLLYHISVIIGLGFIIIYYIGLKFQTLPFIFKYFATLLGIGIYMKTKVTNYLCKIVKNKINIAVYLSLFIIYMVIILGLKGGNEYDINCWKYWAGYIFNNGLDHIYDSSTNYLPLFQFILYFFGKIQGNISNIEKNVYYLKIFTLIFDFIGGLVLLKLIYKKFKNIESSILYSLLFFLNIAYFYNTLIWGQVDGIMVTLILLSFFFAIKRKVLLTLLFVILSINFKLQVIIFLPLIGLMILPKIVKKFSLKNIIIWVSVSLSIQFLLLLPFMSNDIIKLWNVIKNSSHAYPFISMNAYNFWYFIFRGDLTKIGDNILFLGVTLKKWGLFLFFVTSFMAILPLAKDIYRVIIYKQKIKIQKNAFLAASLIPLLFFFFNTQMHERYSHSAIIFLAGYAILYNRIFPYLLASLAYFLNLEGVLKYFKFSSYETVIFNPVFVAIIYLIVILLLFYDLYGIKNYIKKILFHGKLRTNN